MLLLRLILSLYIHISHAVQREVEMYFRDVEVTAASLGVRLQEISMVE